MIVSVHVPKTAGTSFRADLVQVFGARLLTDYEDWPEATTPEAAVHNERTRAAMLAAAELIGERYDAICGHFVAGKYAGVFPFTALVTMLRDPYQHAVSTYEHAMRPTVTTNPAFSGFSERHLTLIDFIESFPNHQSLYVDNIPLEDFAMIGMTERYDQSVALFEAMFGITMPRATRQNTNPTKHGAEYEITPGVRRAVERFRAEDIELYRRAGERLSKLCLMYAV